MISRLVQSNTFTSLYNPIAAIPGAIVSTGADALNIGIDMFRQGATHQRIRGRSGAQRALSESPTTGL